MCTQQDPHSGGQVHDMHMHCCPAHADSAATCLCLMSQEQGIICTDPATKKPGLKVLLPQLLLLLLLLLL